MANCGCSSLPLQSCALCGGAPKKADFLRIWKDVLPESYTAPIEAEGDGRGQDVPAALSAIFERWMCALEEEAQSYYLRPWSGATGEWASGAKKAEATVVVSRTPPCVGAVEIPAGTVLEASRTDSYGERLLLARFITLSAAALLDGETGPLLVDVQAEYAGTASNVAEGTITGFASLGTLAVDALVQTESQLAQISSQVTGDSLSGVIVGRYVTLSGPALDGFSAQVPRRIVGASPSSYSVTIDPPLPASAVGSVLRVSVVELSDLGLVVEHPAAACGGRDAKLDAIGSDRIQPRALNESDEGYRARLTGFPDVISPGAVERALFCTLGACGIPYRFDETGVTLMGFTWDLDEFDSIDPSKVMLSKADQTRVIIVTVGSPTSGADSGVGFAFDDGPEASAFDDGQMFDSPTGGAESPDYIECIDRAYSQLDFVRAAGVRVLFVREQP